MRRTALALALALAPTAACKPSPPPDPKPEPTAGAREAPPPPSAAPAPTPLATSIPATIDPATPPLHLVWEGDSPPQTAGANVIALSVVGGGALLSHGYTMMRASGDALTSIAWDLEPIRGFFSAGRVQYLVGGRYPDALWATINLGVYDGARTVVSPTIAAHLSGGVWLRVDGPLIGHVAAWSEKRTIGVTRAGLEVLDGSRAHAPPFTASKAEGCTRRVKIGGFDALATGEIFTVGEDCEHPGRVVVERVDAKGALTIDELPGFPAYKAGAVYAIHAASPTAVVASIASEQASGLARFDGAAWARLELPPDMKAIRHAAIAPDGAVFVVASARVHRVSKDGKWTTFAFGPESKTKLGQVAPLDLYAASADDVWVTGVEDMAPDEATGMGRGGKRSLVLRSQKGTVVKVTEGDRPEVLTWASRPAEEKDPQPLTPACATPFVQLYGASMAQSADWSTYAFPATGKALAGERRFRDADFLTYKLKGDPSLEYFGASVATAAEAEELAALVKEKVKGSAPKPVCFKPAYPAREIRFAR